MQLIAGDPTLKLGAALDRVGHPHLGEDCRSSGRDRGDWGADQLVVARRRPAIDVMIDFSLPEGPLRRCAFCAERRVPLVVGTTGFDPGQRVLMEGYADEIPLLIAPT